MRIRHLLLLAALVLAATGCQGTKYSVVPVTGKLTWADGTPLPAGTKIRFTPYEGGMGTCEAVTSQDGSFTVKHSSGRTGAEEGKYIVLLSAPDGDAMFYRKVPKDYYDGGVFMAEVKTGMSPLEFKVQGGKK